MTVAQSLPAADNGELSQADALHCLHVACQARAFWAPAADSSILHTVTTAACSQYQATIQTHCDSCLAFLSFLLHTCLCMLTPLTCLAGLGPNQTWAGRNLPHKKLFSCTVL